ncbi:hypothetical protein J1N35_006295 [Gossypium stocksii]|uniref:DUF4283 domain-containing protein n=1 Tax=Gossypium stocksii TaxID=47602 RepID=A0A9D3WHE6_9ROSI|nr:hypothetical protein J1N35_006295 [Gossypium stocksii]
MSEMLHVMNFVIGVNLVGSNAGIGYATKKKVEDFELQEGDVTTEMKIAFNTLLNKVTMLWNSKHPFQLMDLENDYYLVHFNDEEDHNNVLTNGPWVRLLRLLEGYYSKFILKVIGQAIGSVLKIDENTYSAKRG